ncbi:MAG: hypothetical protein V1698_01020 [bacterium]
METKITEDDLKYILGEDCKIFREKILSNCFCSKCLANGHETVTIVDYEIFLNDQYNDVILRGFCKNCRRKVVRCLETGEGEKCLERIGEIKKNIKL